MPDDWMKGRLGSDRGVVGWLLTFRSSIFHVTYVYPADASDEDATDAAPGTSNKMMMML